jgi:molecular chaperone DnaJ
LDTRNAFAELGLEPGATAHEVKAAWRRLVSHWHPDRNPSDGALVRMQRINDAFRIVRQALGAAHGVPTHDETPASSAPEPAAKDARARTEPQGDRPSDDEDHGERRTVHRKLRLTLEEAAAGCTKVLQGKLADTCTSCMGVGYQMPEPACEPCEGSGQVGQASWFGWLNTKVACEACAGLGRFRLDCQPCDGTGKLDNRRYQVKARIPQGVRSGDRLTVSPRRTRSGDMAVELQLRIELIEHDLFTLEPDGTVRCEMPVDGFAWIANRTVQVPTLAGLQPLALNRERLSYRLEQQGFPVQRRGARGDLVITVQPVFPQRMSADQDILLDQLMATFSGPDGRSEDPRLSSWQRNLQAWERSRQRRETSGR